MATAGFHDSETEATKRLERRKAPSTPQTLEDKKDIVTSINRLANSPSAKVTIFLFQHVLIVHNYTYDGKWYTVEVSAPITANTHYWISSDINFVFQVHASGELFNAT